MALKPKTAILQIRLDPELLARYQLFADSHEMTVSDALRRQMAAACSTFEAENEKARLNALRASKAPTPSPESFQLEKSPPDPPRRPEEPKKTRAQRRAEERRARK